MKDWLTFGPVLSYIRPHLSIFRASFERLFDLNHDGTLDPLEKGLEFTVIEDIMNDDEDNDDLFSSDLDDEFDTDFDDDF